MHRRSLPLLLLLVLGCAAARVPQGSPPPAAPRASPVPVPTAPAAAPLSAPLASPMRADLGRASDDVDVSCDDLKTAPIRWGVVILGSDPELAAAELEARRISATTGIPFSTEGFSIDPKTKRAVHQRSYDGGYYPRTSSCGDGKECITVERSSAYATFTPNLFVIVGAVVDDDVPESFAKYRAHVPDAYVKYSPLTDDPGGYGATSACMDWDVIVLARTALLAEAEAIAEHVSELSGVPYTRRTPPPGANDYHSDRRAPFPSISVESDNAYGESGDSPYFLVVGGERGEPGDAGLFERYQKVVPSDYRMKRARHVCGA